MDSLKVKCDKCFSEHVVNHGNVTTVKKGKRQRFKCQSCGHTFYSKNIEICFREQVL